MKHKKGVSRFIVLVLAGSLCFFIAHRSPVIMPGIVEKLGACLVYPFLKAQLFITQPVKDFVTRLSFSGTWDQQYTALVKERDDLQAQLLALQAVQFFTEETEEIREFSKRYETEHALLVRILLKFFGNEGHFFIVEGGSYKGIHKDTAVVYKNCLIGKVSEVYPFSSKVVLITDPGCKVAAYCNGAGTPGIYEGSYSLTQGALKHVGYLSKLEVDDTVFSSGEGLVFPRGFGIGTITSFEKNEGDMQYTVAVAPLIDVTTLNYCYILDKELMQQGDLGQKSATADPRNCL